MSARWFAAWLALAGGGCSALFGIDTVSLADVDAAPDATDPDQVRVTAEFLIAARGTHTTAPVNYGFAARSADGTVISSTTNQTPTDTRVVFDVPPGATYFLDAGGGSEYQSNERELHLVSPWIGRFDAPALQSSTPFAVTVTQAASSTPSISLLASTGVRAQFGVAADATSTVKYVVDYQKFTAIGNAPIRVPDATAGDRLYFTRLQLTSQPPAYYAPTSAGSTPFSLVDGSQNTQFAIAAAAQTLDHCFPLVAPIMTELARVAPAPLAPASWAVGPSQAQWQVMSVPDWRTDGPYGGLVVARSNMAAPESDFTGQVCYHSVFGETELVLMFAMRTFYVALAGTAPSTTAFLAGVSAYLPIDPANPAAKLDFSASQLAIQGPVMLAGAPLVGDHATPTFSRSAPVSLDIPVAVAGNLTPTDYGVTLWELTAGGSPLTTIARAVFAWSVTAPHVSIDPAKLAPGHHYVFQIAARVGYPDAPDYRRPAYPYIGAITWSTDFTAP